MVRDGSLQLRAATVRSQWSRGRSRSELTPVSCRRQTTWRMIDGGTRIRLSVLAALQDVGDLQAGMEG
ncbi:MAG TPA: hypothetical protein VGW38_04925 [Chloroflexota bacterium]|nr:hypothetical protein [Chloroflexota bacterium]